MLGNSDGVEVGIEDGVTDGTELGLTLKDGIILGGELGIEDGKAQCGEVTSNTNLSALNSSIDVVTFVAVISST